MELLTRNNFEGWMQKLMERLDRQDELLLAMKAEGKQPTITESIRSGIVNIPVIFSKFSGVKDRNTKEYWVTLKQLMTPETLVIDSVPYILPTDANPMKMFAAEFFKNGRLHRNVIKNHRAYQYGFLREDMQEHILDKIELLLQQKSIKGTFENGTEYTIVAIALNLPKEVTRLLQAFDFTKKNPKLIYLNT